MSEQFDPKELKGAVAAVGTAFEEFKKANDQRLKEIEAKGSADPLLEEKMTKINETIDASQKRLDDFELAMKRRNRIVTDASGEEIDLDKKAQSWANVVKGANAPAFGADKLAEYKAGFRKFIVGGSDYLEPDERKAMSIGSDPDGGYWVHPDMSGGVVKKVFETTPMRAYATVQAISSDRLEGTYDLDEAGASWVGETQSRSATDTPQIGRWSIVAHELSANVPITQRLLDDSEVNVEGWIAEKVADKFARSEATAFVTGTGVAQPRGFLTYADGSTLPSTIEQFDTGVNGGFAAAPAGGDVLISALYGLKAQYRANAVWAANRGTQAALRKLKDSDGSYLWAAGISAGQPATVLGYPIASFEDMPAIATGSLSIAVGDWRSAYRIVDRVGMRMLRDPYTNKPNIMFYTTKRVGGDVVNFEALKLINFQA